MANLLFMGFDHEQNVTQVGQKLNAILPGSSTNAVSLVAGGPYGVGYYASANNKVATCIVPNNAHYFCGGYWFRDTETIGSWQIVFSDGGTTQTYLNYSTTQLTASAPWRGFLDIRKGSDNSLLASGTRNVADRQWHHIDVDVKIANGAGSWIKVWVDDILDIELYDADLQTTGNAQINQIWFGTGSWFSAWDDIYINDDTGTAPFNDRLGSARVATIMPSGAGNYTEWTPSAGANYQCVDEVPANVSDYNTGTIGQRDTFVTQNMPVGTPRAVQTTIIAKHDDVGTISLSALARIGSTDTETAAQNLTTGFLPYVFRPTNPNGGDWVEADVNSAEFGYKRTA